MHSCFISEKITHYKYDLIEFVPNMIVFTFTGSLWSETVKMAVRSETLPCAVRSSPDDPGTWILLMDRNGENGYIMRRKKQVMNVTDSALMSSTQESMLVDRVTDEEKLKEAPRPEKP